LLGASYALSQTPIPDRILVNGAVLTVDEDFSIVEALAIADDKILAVGTTAEIEQLAGPDTAVVELSGKTVIPGLIDNHSRVVTAARGWGSEVRLEGISSRREALAAIASKAQMTKDGGWIFALRGWTPSQFVDAPGMFSREELDEVAPDNPVLAVAGMARTGTANSKAIEVAGLTGQHGNVAGAAAINAIVRSAQSTHSWQEGIRLLTADFVRVGLTTVYDSRAISYQALDDAASASDLPLRIYHSFNGQGGRGGMARTVDVIAEELRSTAPLSGDERLAQFGFGEDTLRSLRDTAAGWQSTPQIEADYRKISLAGAEAGWQFHEHSMLENKISFVIDTYEAVNDVHSIEDLRWTLHHATFLSLADVARVKTLNLGVAIHSHGALQEPRATAFELEVMSGPPMFALEEAGVTWGLGTDFGGPPITVYNPFITLWWATTGKSLGGAVVNTQPVSRVAALIAHTRSNAYLLHKDRLLGTLEPGKFADLIVLDRDYMAIPDDDIRNIQPVMTMIGGEIVYQSDDR